MTKVVSLLLTIASLAAICGCDAQKANDAFRTRYARSYLANCLAWTRQNGLERVGRPFCICAANEQRRRLSTAEIVELSLGPLAPKHAADTARAITKKCSAQATRSMPHDNSCNADAIVINPVQPRYPESVSAPKRRLTAGVEVTIRTNGLVKNARLYRSSGNPVADAAALKAARSSTYWPKFASCRPVESHYLFKAVFDPSRD